LHNNDVTLAGVFEDDHAFAGRVEVACGRFIDDESNREDEGMLLVPKAGEMLFHLTRQPA